MSTENSIPAASTNMEHEFKPRSDDILIDFNGEDDPYRPLNWPIRRKKVVVTLLYSLCTMGTTWASTMSVLAPLWRKQSSLIYMTDSYNSGLA